MRRLWWALLVVLVVAGLPAPVVASGHRHPPAVERIRVDHRLFGLHDASLDSLASSGVGSLRLWDTGVTWRNLASYDPQSGAASYDWSRLDTIVRAAGRHHVELTLVLGQTPSYLSDAPGVLPTSAIPAYRDYVEAVMQRYGDKIHAYQVWNEANVVNFWQGSYAELAKLTEIVHDARDAYAPGSLVVSAPLLTRQAGQRRWLTGFARTRVDGRPVWRYLDAFALHLYPQATYGDRPGIPEDSLRLLAKSRSRLAAAGWPRSMPIWVTEVNYGLQGDPTTGPVAARPVSDAVQASYVIRTYLLDAAHRIARVYWYSWDMAGMPGGTRGNTLLTDPDDHTVVTPAGRAFTLVQTWLRGTLVGHGGHGPCVTDRHGTYTCTVRYGPHRVGRIYWNPTRSAHVRLVRSATTDQDELGHTRHVRGHTRLRVDLRPVLVRSRG